MKALSIFILIGAVLFPTLFTLSLEAHQSDKSEVSQVKAYIRKSEIRADSSSYYLHKAYEVARTAIGKARVNRLLAEHYQSLNQKDSAILRLKPDVGYPFSELDHDLQLEMARSYVLLDRVSGDSEEMETCVSRLRNAIPPLEQKMPDSIDLSWAYLRLGIRLWYSERYSEAEKWWEKAYRHSKEFGYTQVEIKAMHHQGFIYTKELRLKLSRSHYKYLISLIERSAKIDPEDHILAVNALGSAFNWDERLDSALFYYAKGLRLLQKHEADSSLRQMVLSNEALIKNNIGKTYLKKKNYRSAAAFLEEAILLNQEQFGSESTHLIRSLRDLGKTYQFLGYTNQAKTAFIRALEISKQNDFDIPKSYSRLADYYAKEEQFDKSLLYYDSAVLSTGTFLAQKKDLYIHGVNLYTTIYGHSKVLASSDSVDLENLDQLFARFNETIQFFYGRIESETFFQWVPLILENLYLAYSKIYDQSNDTKVLDRLWEITELNKAVKLRKQLKNEDSFQYSVPADILDRGKTLRNDITLQMAKVQPGSLDSTLFFLNREYDEYLKELEDQYPRYYALKNEIKITPLRQIRRDLKTGTMLINFLEGEKQIYALRLSRRKITKQVIDKEDISDAIASHNEAVLNRNRFETSKQSLILRQQLALSDPDIEHIEHFHIIPDGILWNLNFAAVMNIDNRADKSRRDEYTFSFNYFAGRELPKISGKSEKMLAFAFSEATLSSSRSQFRNSDEDVSTIPGTSAEVKSIAEIWEGSYYFGTKANETTFKSLGGQYSILHLAIHGFLNETSPEKSYLKFAAPDDVNDGKLYVYEIYNLDLNADLGVLSACHSGQGKIVAGEGMMSLGRAFAYAGVRSLLISRWEVSDYSAPHLMKYFYEGLKDGMYKSEALKHAQTKYLENHSDALTSSPFYWSSFYVLGDDNPIHKSASLSLWLIWLLVAILLSGGVFYRRKRTRTTR